jgi:enoyl-CoA hydratase/carnithine racemase
VAETMQETSVTFSKRDGIGVITLNRPGANAYNFEVMRQLNDAVDVARLDTEVKVIILSSGLEKFFSAGADINMLKAAEPPYKASFCLFCQETLMKLERTPKIVIAQLGGHCVGGGLEIALACDLRFMAAGPYQIGLPEVKLGVLPGTGGTQRLPRLVGKSRGLDLIITGRLLTPEQALEIGLVDRVFPKEDLEIKTMEYAQEIASGPSRTIGLIKVAVTEGIEMPLSGGLALEREVQNQLFQNQDAKEGLAAYVEKRKPKFTGR